MAPNLELAMLVAPWVRELTDRTTLLYNDRVRQPWCDDLVFVAVDTSRAPEPRVFEALELLALLQCVDLEAWIVVVSVVWGPDTLNEIIASKRDGFELACELTFSPGHTATIVQWCERLVVDGIEWTASPEYLHVRSELEAMLRVSERDRERPRIHVHLLSELMDYEDVLAQFEHVVALQSMRASTQAPYVKWPPLFQVVFLDVFPFWPDGFVASERVFLRLVQFASCGIEQSCLLVDDLRIDSTKASLCVPGLQLLLHTRAQPGQAHVGVSDVFLGGLFSGQTSASLFSALLVSSSVDAGAANRDLIFETTADRTRFWRWFALAYFSDATTLPAGYLSISLNNLRDGDVASMRALLNSADPISFACFDGIHTTQLAPPSLARWTTASRFALEQPQETTTSTFENLFTCEPQQVCLVGDRSSDTGTSAWQAVLLPGWGLAWMPTTDVLSCADRSPRSGPHGARQLNLVNIDDTSQPTTLELLAVIGHRLRRLSLGLLSTTMPLDRWLQQVVRNCPALEDLNLSSDARLQSLGSLPSMFERPDCVLRRLALENVAIQDGGSIARFVECLGDPTHPMAKTLRRFSLTLTSFPSRLVGIDATVEAMLESNIWLQEFVLRVHFQADVVQEDVTSSRERFAPFDGAPIAVELAPLDADRKRAFLGVVRAARAADGTHSTIAPMQKFDGQVLSLIFDFAAPCQTRRVVVEFSYDGVGGSDSEAEEEEGN